MCSCWKVSTPLKLTAFVPRRFSKIILLSHLCDQLILPHFECLSLELGLQISVMRRRIWQGGSKFPPLWKGTACVACKFQWRNLRSYLSWVMPMTFTWSPPNVSTTSWCQLKSTKEYSPTNASLDQMGNCLNYTTGLIFKTLPKAQRTRGLSPAHQSNFFRSYHKFSRNLD